jgi:N-methylhydantoinase A
MDDANIIGAGGGSIAWIDKGGALNVGPQSSSAMPGPACYGRGGEEPTVTDANVVLGRISPNYFLGGEIKLHLEYAKSAIVKKICSKTGLSLEEGAAGIIRVVNANMSKAISVKSIQKGYDLREFSLIAFGGAGPLHAVDIAEDLGIGEVIIPMYPGAFSAFGLLVADTRHDYTQTIMCSEDKIKPSELLGIWKELERKGISALESDHIPPESRIIQWSADLRFEGQSYELNIPVQRKEGLHDLDIKKLFVDFAKEHEKIYSFKAIDEKSIIVNIRVTAIGKSPKIIVEKLRGGDKDSSKALKGKRKVFFEDVGFIETKIYERNSLTAGNVVEGPAVVEEAISCTVIKPGKVATIDSLGNIMIKV